MLTSWRVIGAPPRYAADTLLMRERPLRDTRVSGAMILLADALPMPSCRLIFFFRAPRDAAHYYARLMFGAREIDMAAQVRRVAARAARYHAHAITNAHYENINTRMEKTQIQQHHITTANERRYARRVDRLLPTLRSSYDNTLRAARNAHFTVFNARRRCLSHQSTDIYASSQRIARQAHVMLSFFAVAAVFRDAHARGKSSARYEGRAITLEVRALCTCAPLHAATRLITLTCRLLLSPP